jgi:hypothetical protein
LKVAAFSSSVIKAELLVKVKGIATPQGLGVRVKEGRVRVENFEPFAYP